MADGTTNPFPADGGASGGAGPDTAKQPTPGAPCPKCGDAGCGGGCITRPDGAFKPLDQQGPCSCQGGCIHRTGGGK